MTVENVGRVAAYKWQLQRRGPHNLAADRPNAYVFNASRLPIPDPQSGIRADDTILPGGSMEERLPFTISLPAHMAGAPDVIQPELSHLLKDVELEYRVATETGGHRLVHGRPG